MARKIVMYKLADGSEYRFNHNGNQHKYKIVNMDTRQTVSEAKEYDVDGSNLDVVLKIASRIEDLSGSEVVRYGIINTDYVSPEELREAVDVEVDVF